MGTTYDKAPQEVHDLLQEVMNDYHPELASNDVTIGILMARAPVKKDGTPTGKPAIRGYGSAAASACIKNLSLKDRILKGFCAELLIDEDVWNGLNDKGRIALLDHELNHLRLKRDKEGDPMKDDHGFTCLRMIKDDIVMWGFDCVIRRHGMYAIETRSLKRLATTYGQFLLPLEGVAQEKDVVQFPENTITISAPGYEPVTLTPGQLKQVGQRVKRQRKPLLIMPEQGSMWVSKEDVNGTAYPVTAIDGETIHLGNGTSYSLADLYEFWAKVPAVA